MAVDVVSADVTMLPHRDTVRAVLMKRLSVGSIASGEIDDDRGAFLREWEALRAAINLADECDLIAVQA